MSYFSLQSVRFRLCGVATALVVTALVWSLPVQRAYAQETPEQPAVQEVELKARAGKDRNVVVGRTVLFDGSASSIPADAPVEYVWNFGDGETAEGVDATHVYDVSGNYKVVLTVTMGTDESRQVSEAAMTVSVQDRLVVLITDQSVPEKDITDIQNYALTQGTLIIPIRDSGVDQEYLTVQNVAQQLLEQEEDVSTADAIITWTSANAGLNAFLELSRISSLNNTSLDRFHFNNKVIVAISDQSVLSGAKLAQTTFQAIQPRYIVLSDRRILDDVVRYAAPDDLERALPTVDAEYQVINEYTARGLQDLGPFNFMSYALNYMINRGVPIHSLFLILMLPVMATIIAAARQIVGIKAFGIFAPTVIALSFLATGIKYGVTMFFAIILIGTVSRVLMRKFRLLYLPRMAMVLSILALSIFAMFFVGAYFDRTGFIAISVFPILIMTVLTEHFISVQIEQGYKAAIKLTLETLALSVLGFVIGDWTLFKAFILAYPEFILLTFVVNYLLGKFSGLRLVEYVRFRNVFKHIRDAGRSK